MVFNDLFKSFTMTPTDLHMCRSVSMWRLWIGKPDRLGSHDAAHPDTYSTKKYQFTPLNVREGQVISGGTIFGEV